MSLAGGSRDAHSVAYPIPIRPCRGSPDSMPMAISISSDASCRRRSASRADLREPAARLGHGGARLYKLCEKHADVKEGGSEDQLYDPESRIPNPGSRSRIPSISGWSR